MRQLLRMLGLGTLVAGLLLAGSVPAPAEDKKDPFADMIGKPAPDFKSGFALNGKGINLADLKGKVVLLDFWAVWCGPCVATFPHLTEWHKAYKDKGLVIVGVTSYYEQIGFDKDKGKLIRAESKLTSEQEQGMLKDFAAHHKLEHLLMALPKDDVKKLYEDYKVKGIPHAVLIDRKGNVQLVKVGSGDANANAIEAGIKKLIEDK